MGVGVTMGLGFGLGIGVASAPPPSNSVEVSVKNLADITTIPGDFPELLQLFCGKSM